MTRTPHIAKVLCSLILFTWGVQAPAQEACYVPRPCSPPLTCVPAPTSLPPIGAAGRDYVTSGGHCGGQRCYVIFWCPCGPPLVSGPCDNPR